MAILVMEGNDHVRDVIAAILEWEGYDAVLAANGMEALQQMRRRSDIVLALVDATADAQDAWTLRRTILADRRLARVPIVMMTGAMPPSHLPAGMLLKKPFGMSELLETVRTRASRVRPRKWAGAAQARPATRSKRRAAG